MPLYEVWEVEAVHTPLGSGTRRVTVLGRIRADHQPAAMLKVSARWPKLAAAHRLTVRPVKWLNEVRRKHRS